MSSSASWISALLSSGLASTGSTDKQTGATSTTSTSLQVSALHRYAVKGLSSDALPTVDLTTNRFPDDRKYALLQEKHMDNHKPGVWLHKENFWCAFTHPQLLATYRTSYNDGSRELIIQDRATDKTLLGPVRMDTEEGRGKLARFLSEQSKEKVVCVGGNDFQYGNTSSGVKNGDSNAQSIHIVFQATVDALQERIGIPLNPTRFRPNIVLQSHDVPAFSEFEWIGKTLQSDTTALQLKIINKTVRCKGVSVDPLDPGTILDIPELLIKHFSEHGPFLGVYCVVETPGLLSVGDTLRLLN